MYGTIYIFCVILISDAYVLYTNIYTFIYYYAIKNKQFLYLCKFRNIINNTDGFFLLFLKNITKFIKIY